MASQTSPEMETLLKSANNQDNKVKLMFKRIVCIVLIILLITLFVYQIICATRKNDDNSSLTFYQKINDSELYKGIHIAEFVLYAILAAVIGIAALKK